MKSIAQMSHWQETMGGLLSSTPIILILACPAALLLGLAIGRFSPLYGAAAAAALFMVIIVLFRLDGLTVALLIAVHLLVDWYLDLHLAGALMSLALLMAYYFGQSAERPWTGPRAPWLWALFLALTIYPALNGGQYMLYDLASYYPNDVVGALLMYWLGSIVAKDAAALRRVLQILAAFGALLAVHTLIEARLGVFLFDSPRSDAYLLTATNYYVAGTGASRAVSFFLDPNWNGAFFAMAFFLPLGLFIETRSPLAKLVYLVEMSLMLPALLFTYSTGAWIGFFGGMVAFIAWVGRRRYRVFFIALIALAALLIFVVFPSQIAVELQHASGPDELSLRLGAWETGIQVIKAFPLFGVGLGYQAYLLRANPYRVPAQFVPLSHPHDSYIEWGAMAGLPVLIVFLLLLAAAFWFAWRNWLRADISTRPLLCAGLAAMAALSINSISINGWTLPPLAAFGWLIAGLVASPLLARALRQPPRLSRRNNAPPIDGTAETELQSPVKAQSAMENVLC